SPCAKGIMAASASRSAGMSKRYVGDTDDVSKDDGNDDNGSGKLGYKLMATFASVVGAVAARKVLRVAWKTSTGKQPPANPEHPEVTWGEAISWAVLSGAVVGVARMAAQRKVASSWHRSTGHLPPGLEETAA